MPKHFDANMLKQLTNTEEIEIETRSPTGRTRRTTIWVIVDDNDVYVRSLHGGNGHWYQNITAKPDAAIHIDRRPLAVHALSLPAEALISRLSSHYVNK